MIFVLNTIWITRPTEIKEIFAIKISWSTRSKAFLRSRKTAPTTRELLIWKSQLSHILAKAVWQECLGRKPDCDWLNRLRSFRKLSKCLWMCLSNGCKIQGDGRKFLDRFKSYFGSQISSQSLNEVHIYRLQPKSATKKVIFFIYFCHWLFRVGVTDCKWRTKPTKYC